MPTRVVDIGPANEACKPLLLSTDGRRGRYIALSDCWGGMQKSITTQQNIERFQHALDLQELSQTAQDAIKVCRSLGIRHLWIDSLCVIQNEPDHADFRRESVRMADYYGNAYLTIVAGRASKSSEGFLWCPPRQRMGCAVSCGDLSPLGPSVASTPAWLCPADNIRTGPLEGRAWTLQEERLSPRLLIYGEAQLMFRRRVKDCYEGGTLPLFPARHVLDVETKDVALAMWYTLLRQYLIRSLSDPLDKITGISGLAQRMHNRIGGKYMFGLWEQDLIDGLLWTNGKMNEPLQLVRHRAPSWSWAAWEGITAYGTQRMSEPKAVVLSHDKVPHSFDPIRQIQYAPGCFEVRIRGSIVQASCGPIIGSRDELSRNLFFMRAHADTPHGRGKFGRMPPERSTIWCLRLTTYDGLILLNDTDRHYQRIGRFQLLQEEIFERNALHDQEITLI